MIPRLPPSAWHVLAADFMSALGSGLSLPFLLIYLHKIRGLDVEIAAEAIATIGLVALAMNPLGGYLSDRWGPRTLLVAGLVLSGLGTGGWLLVTRPWQAFAVAAIFALGISMSVPAQSALLGSIAAPSQRSAVFSVAHMTLNVGLGVGSLAASLIVDSAHADAFTAIYVLDASTFLIASAIVGRCPLSSSDELQTQSADDRPVGEVRSGYREVFRDRVFVRVWILSAVLVTAGFGQMQTTVPAVAMGEGGLQAQHMGVIYAVNTVVVVALQLIVLRLVANRRRTRVLMALALLWATSWALTFLAAVLPFHRSGVLALFVAATAVFALGETLLAPSLPALVNDLAPEKLRGSYNGALALAYTVGFTAGPLVSGWSIGHGRTTVLLVGLAAACVVTLPLAYGLEGHIADAVNRIPGAPSERGTRRSPERRAGAL
ncbi:MDR family MFS transporter [Streptomyces sp. NPDC099088]|uniref:MDR family MFS transporter n=1 Tax=Streptomyces sp. NPDC099088 TaxID=3366101 RepID=UPI0038267A10